MSFLGWLVLIGVIAGIAYSLFVRKQ